MCIWCMQCLRAHTRMYCAKKRREKKNCWPCACEQDSTEGERKPLIATHMHRLLWLSLNVCIEREIPESYDVFFCSSDIVFARRSASYIVVYYRYGRCLPVCTTLLPSRKMYRNIRNASLQTPSPVVKYTWQTVQLLPEPPWLPDLVGAPLPVSLLFCLAPWTLKMVLSLLLVASEFPACSALWNWMRCLAARSGWETRLRKEKLCFCLVKKFYFIFFLAWRKSLTPHCHRPRALGGHILSVWQRRRDSHIHSVRCLPSCIYNTSNVGVSNICPH